MSLSPLVSSSSSYASYPSAAAASAASSSIRSSYAAVDQGEVYETGQEYPQGVEGESRVFAPIIDSLDFALLRLTTRVVKEVKRVGVAAWIPFSGTWNDAYKDIEAQNIFNESEAKKVGEAKEGEVDNPNDALLDRIHRASRAASKGNKWIYDIEKAELYLKSKNLGNAEVVLERLKTYQNLNTDAHEIFTFLLAKIKALQGKLAEAYQIYNGLGYEYVINLKEVTDKSRENLPGIVKLLIQKVKDNIAQTTDEEQLIIAQQMDISNEVQVFQVLDVFVRGNPEAWKVLANRIPEEKLRWQDLEILGSCCRPLENQKAISYFSKAIERAPDDQVERLWSHCYQLTKKTSVLKKLAQLGDPKMMIAYAREIKESDSVEALGWVKRAMQVSSPFAAGASDSSSSAAPPGGAPAPDEKQVEGSDLATYQKAKELYHLICWEQGAATQNAECMFRLALCYQNGTHEVEKDLNQVKKLLDGAHNRGHWEAAFTYANISKNDPEKQLWLARATDIGHKEAPYQLGLMALTQYGALLAPGSLRETVYMTNAITTPLEIAIARENNEAIQLKLFCSYLKNITKGSGKHSKEDESEAYYHIARCFNGEGEGVCTFLPKSPSYYEEWLKWAAAYGHPKALILHASKMTKENLILGVNRLRNRLDAEAQYLLASYLETGMIGSFKLNEIVKKNPIEAKELFIKSAEQNYLPACMKLAEIYTAEGEYPKAFVQYRNASELGDTEALFQLGLCFKEGRGCELDQEAALAKMLLATEQGHGKSMTAIGDFYKAKNDRQNAEEWYTKATTAKIPDGEAFARLASLAE